MALIARTAAAALALALALLACPALAGEAEDLIAQGSQHVKQKDLRKAAEAYEKAVKKAPKDARAHLLLGLTYANLGELEKAERHSRTSAELEPSYPAFYNLGLIHANRGDHPKAIEAYSKALALNPSSYGTLYQMGLVHAASGNFQKAIDCYYKVLQHNPRYEDAYLGLASAYYWSDRKEMADAQVGKLRELKQGEKAEALEKWLRDKEARKPASPKSPEKAA